MHRSLRRIAESKRLLVRAPEVRDFEGIAGLWTDAEVTRYIGGPRDLSLLCDHFERYASDPEGFAAEERECWWTIIDLSDEAFVGLCALVWKEVDGQQEVDLGYFLVPRYWGRGYGFEAVQAVIAYAFGELGLASVVALIHPDNTASRALAERLGMWLDRELRRPDGVVRCMYRLLSSA